MSKGDSMISTFYAPELASGRGYVTAFVISIEYSLELLRKISKSWEVLANF